MIRLHHIAGSRTHTDGGPCRAESRGLSSAGRVRFQTGAFVPNLSGVRGRLVSVPALYADDFYEVPDA